ncbi:hypothetical protein C8R45DRAFT_1101248 [Mycena sanguinolenta]|nr:hypothetical protein C8R45DRAFT_1101248 [Mycena sanguinolenta]
MASAGLSRRRAPAAASTTTDDDERAPTSPLAESRDNNDSSNPSTINAHAGSAFANGSRIAFNPRDLALSSSEDALVGGKLPKLTLMEEVLLLGIFGTIISAMRCGGKRLPLPDRPIAVLSTRQTGETLLDETLKMTKQTVDGGEKMGVGTWVDLLSAALFTRGTASPAASASSAHPRPHRAQFLVGLGSILFYFISFCTSRCARVLRIALLVSMSMGLFHLLSVFRETWNVLKIGFQSNKCGSAS